MSGNPVNAPFLNVQSFELEGHEFEASAPQLYSPTNSAFLSVYNHEGFNELSDPQSEAYLNFINELYSEEFDEALYELMAEVSDLHQDRLSSAFEPEQLLERHIEPLVREAETMFEALAKEFGQRDINRLTEGEIDATLSQYAPTIPLSPAFENFFGGLKNLVKKAVKGATDLAKTGLSMAAKFGLGPILDKLKALIRPLLKRVFQTAIGKLPEKLQPIARKLAEKLPFLNELEVEESEREQPSSLAVNDLQHEFNAQIANLLFAPGEIEQELEVARIQSEATYPTTNSVAELDEARERFIGELGNLREGEDPTPLLENFIPAILPALKLGIGLAGRGRVVNFLADQIAKLIGRFVGPEYTPPLSRAIVDAGLRLIHLETNPENESRVAHEAVASTVEETLQQIAAFPKAVLSSPELLEAYTLEAFEQAAAANLPNVLSEETYRQRPDLRETCINGLWMHKRLPGKSGFRKFSHVFKKRICAHDAMVVQTFGGETLSEHLQEQLGLPSGAEVEAEFELYEFLPGTTVAEVARAEGSLGVGGVHSQALAEFHPLTQEAASVLLGEPRLGKPVTAATMSSPMGVKTGDRVYKMKVLGHRPLMTSEPGGNAKVPRRSRINVRLDFPKNQIQIGIFLSEVSAQKLATRLRGKPHLGVVVNLLQRYMQCRLPPILAGLIRGRIRIIHETLMPNQALGDAMSKLPQPVSSKLAGKLQEWTIQSLSNFFKEDASKFMAATEDSKDGVTLALTISNPPGFPELRQLFKSKIASPPNFAGDTPTVKVSVTAGYADS
jgi:hypothetical protein